MFEFEVEFIPISGDEVTTLDPSILLNEVKLSLASIK